MKCDAVEVMGARDIGAAERRAEPVGEIGEIAAGDEDVFQRLLLLVGEGQQARPPQSAGLDAAGDGEIGGERRLAGGRVGQGRERRQALERCEIIGGLRSRFERRERAGGDQGEFERDVHGVSPLRRAGRPSAARGT